MLFVDDPPVELVALKLLLLELHVAPGLERAETLVEPARPAAIEPYCRPGQVGEQALVVADESERRPAAGEARLQPLDRDQIEVVGRLVEQQDLGFGAKRPDQSRPSRFSAGKTSRIGDGIEPQLGQHRSRLIRVVEFAESRQHIVERGPEARNVRLLGQIGEAGGRLDESGSTIRRRLSRRDAKQRRFT